MCPHSIVLEVQVRVTCPPSPIEFSGKFMLNLHRMLMIGCHEALSLYVAEALHKRICKTSMYQFVM